ncbi:MAG TPA: TIGR03619 family F420-dependent LLM class oxidoreductase [Solirubrobacteraceae bacterium]
MRIGLKLPNSGPKSLDPGVAAMARVLEQAAADSLWVSDHVVMPERIVSPYPFAADGRATWETDMPWLDALVALALAAAVTERVRLGTAVLVLPLREPLVFAKQAATIDVASGGRLELGVGAGWLEEEFDALNVPFERRGARLEEWIALVRAAWTGRPDAQVSERYTLPADTLVYPRPAHAIPVLIGGHSRFALRRAARHGDGWLAHQEADALDPGHIRAGIDMMREAGAERPRVVVRIVKSLGRCDLVAAGLPALAAVGVDEVIVDVPPDDLDAARMDVERLRAAVA